jgi:hypothetical protein
VPPESLRHALSGSNKAGFHAGRERFRGGDVFR